MAYKTIEMKSWNRLINHGPTILVSTRDKNNNYNIAPIAWNCPVQKDPARVLAVIGHSHRTYKNIMATGEYVICVPHQSQAKLVMQTGKSTGEAVDKFEFFSIKTFTAETVDIRIPEGCIGYLECKLHSRLPLEKVDIMVGEVLKTMVNSTGFDGRMRTELAAGKSLHHLGGDTFTLPSEQLLKIEDY